MGCWTSLARLIGHERSALPFAALLAAASVLRSALPGESLTPTFAFAAVVFWLWWLPAWLRAAGKSEGGGQ